MKSSELATIVLEMNDQVNDAIFEAKSTLLSKFEASTRGNEAAAREASMNDAMIGYVLATGLFARFKKQIDYTKRTLDMGIEALGNDPNGVPGDTVFLHSDNVLQFTKKQNRDGTSTLVVDLCTELARLGVEKSVVDEAMKRATKPKRGNVYYQVEVS